MNSLSDAGFVCLLNADKWLEEFTTPLQVYFCYTESEPKLQRPFVGCSLTSFKPTDFFRPVVGRINV